MADEETGWYAKLVRRYRAVLAQRWVRISMLQAIAIFAVGWVANYYAIIFATDRASNSVTDIVLSNIRVFEVDGLFVYGTFIVAGISIALIFWHPRRVPFALAAVGVFWIVRSVFVSLTHLAPYESHIASDFGPRINDLFFGADLFFSAHTGMPFLGALAFWKEKELRYLFLLSSIYFATVVLMGHLHYSIDVASAFFITYGIFHIALVLFPKEWALFKSDLS